MERNNFGLQINFPMPKAAEEFAKAMGYSVVAHCKLDSLRRLPEISTYLGNHMNAIIEFEQHNAVLFTDDLKIPDNTDVFRVAYEIVDKIRHGHRVDRKVSESLGQKLKNLKHECDVAYQPVFDNIFKPIQDMIYMGYDYNNAELINEINQNKDLRTWLNALVLCKTVANLSLTASVEAGEAVIEFQPQKAYMTGYHGWRYGPATMFDSMPMEDELPAGPLDNMKMVKSAAKESRKEAERITQVIFETIKGGDLSMSDKLINSRSKFLSSIVAFLDTKMV